jgi:hypothetical protein
VDVVAAAVVVAVVGGLLVTLIGNLALDLIRGVPKRAQGKMERVLREIPKEEDRERWKEELRGVMAAAEGRPWKQMRQGREVLKAAEELVGIYRTSDQLEVSGPIDLEARPSFEGRAYIPVPVADGARVYMSRRFLVGALEKLSYRERRILELRNGWSGEPPQTVESVGHKFNILPERILQIEGEATSKIESLLETEQIRELQDRELRGDPF